MQDAVEVARHQPDASTGVFGDILDDAVTVPLGLGQHHEDQEIDGF